MQGTSSGYKGVPRFQRVKWRALGPAEIMIWIQRDPEFSKGKMEGTWACGDHNLDKKGQKEGTKVYRNHDLDITGKMEGTRACKNHYLETEGKVEGTEICR